MWPSRPSSTPSCSPTAAAAGRVEAGQQQVEPLPRQRTTSPAARAGRGPGSPRRTSRTRAPAAGRGPAPAPPRRSPGRPGRGPRTAARRCAPRSAPPATRRGTSRRCGHRPAGCSSNGPRAVHAAHRPRPHYCVEAWTGCRTPVDSARSGSTSVRRPPGGPTGATGTPTPTSTSPPTARSSATPASCGGPRAHTRTTPGVLGDVAGKRRARDRLRCRPVLPLGARARRPRGRPRRVRCASCSTPGASTHEPGSSVPAVLRHRHRAAVRRRHLRRRLLGLRRAAVRRRRPRRGRRGGPGAAPGRACSRSRSPTRPAGCSPTTPARAAWSPRSPTGTARRTSRWTTRPARSRYVEHHRTIGDWVGLLAGARVRARRACTSPSGPSDHDRTWGGWGPHPRPAHPGHGDLRGRAAP